jgi:uncharacterized Tic20 family protein
MLPPWPLLPAGQVIVFIKRIGSILQILKTFITNSTFDTVNVNISIFLWKIYQAVAIIAGVSINSTIFSTFSIIGITFLGDLHNTLLSFARSEIQLDFDAAYLSMAGSGVTNLVIAGGLLYFVADMLH